jgi:hypothetical protein
MIPATDNYLPGLNALLNSLDYYGNVIDVWVIDFGLPEEYKQKALAADFCYNLNFYSYTEIVKGDYCLEPNRPSGFYYCVFSPYTLYARLKDKYDAVAFLGSDILVLNNIMPWFEIAAKTDFIVSAGNPYTFVQPDGIKKDHMYESGLIDVSPVSDTPLIMNPKIHFDVIVETLNWGKKTDENLKAVNTALYYTKKMDKVLLMDSQLWTCGLFYLFRSQRSIGIDGKIILFHNNERVHAIHKKYWTDAIIYSAMYDKVPGTWGYECTLNNTRNWSDLFRFFNTNHKVKFEYPANLVFDKLQKGELKLKCELEKR